MIHDLRFTIYARRLRPALLLFCLLINCLVPQPVHAESWLESWRATNQVWRGVHLWLDKDSEATNLIQTLPLRSFGLAWRTLVSQRRHFAVAGIALVLTGAAGVTAAGYDAALTSLASGTRDVGVSSDYRIVTDDPAQQARLDSALQTSPLVAAW